MGRRGIEGDDKILFSTIPALAVSRLFTVTFMAPVCNPMSYIIDQGVEDAADMISEGRKDIDAMARQVQKSPSCPSPARSPG